MWPLVIEALFLVVAAICFFVELTTTGTRRINLIALGLLFITLALLVPPINGIIAR